MLRAATIFGGLCVALALPIALSERPAVAGDGYGRHLSYGTAAAPSAQPFATGWRPADPLVALGQKLFVDARLSGSGTTACASCHDPGYGFAQARRVSISDNGQHGRRNSPSLLDVGLLPKLMWDGRFRTLEQQAFGPFQSGEMGIPIEQAVQRVSSDPQYVQLFQATLGHWPTPDGVAHALATFQRTLVTRASRVDRFLTRHEQTLTSLERDGFEIFTRRAACSRCHQLFPLQGDGRPSGRALFADFQFHNIGVGYNSGGAADMGRYEQSRSAADWGAFRTPSLRNSARTPPYMHDGSFATLEKVVEFYNDGGRPNPNLSPLIRPLLLDGYQKAALVAFLRAMAD